MLQKQKRIAREEERALFFFEATMLVGLVILYGGICVQVKEIIWTGTWLTVTSLVFFKLDVLGIILLAMPGPFVYWYLSKLGFGKAIILPLMALYISLLIASIVVSVKLRKLRNEKEAVRREHFVLRRLQRASASEGVMR